nr:beta-N-acetylglucosaminidase domain-containing protein [Actinomyces johnsonii]
MVVSGALPSSSRLRSLLIPAFLVGLVLGLVSSAPEPTAAAAPDTPALTPAPQSVQWTGPAVDLTGTVEIVKVGGGAGDDVVKAATAIVTDAGGKVVSRSGRARIVVGTDDGNASHYRPASLSVPSQAEGYALTTSSAGVPSVIALGSDASGAFHATTTLRQITVGGKVAGATITDWPAMRVRGVVEGFYGIPWSHRARMDMLSYMGDQRMNTYVYAPKDDPYLRARWRERYPASDLARLKQLSQTARAAHIDLVVALSPGEDICYSSPEDYAAATGVFDQLRDIGITSFYVAFDDISGDFTCDSDTAQFTATGDKAALAQAQAYFLGRIQREYIKSKGLPDLWMAPTQYTGMDKTDYKTTLGKELDPAISVQWTGRGIVTDSITTEQASQAAAAYGTSKLVVWDNFPANDGENQARLFLGAMPAQHRPGHGDHRDHHQPDDPALRLPAGRGRVRQLRVEPDRARRPDHEEYGDGQDRGRELGTRVGGDAGLRRRARAVGVHRLAGLAHLERRLRVHLVPRRRGQREHRGQGGRAAHAPAAAEGRSHHAGLGQSARLLQRRQAVDRRHLELGKCGSGRRRPHPGTAQGGHGRSPEGSNEHGVDGRPSRGQTLERARRQRPAPGRRAHPEAGGHRYGRAGGPCPPGLEQPVSRDRT